MIMETGNLLKTLIIFSHRFTFFSKKCFFYLHSCYFHVFFHGCAMSADNIGTEFIENSGLLEMSEANNIVLLFPQVNLRK